MATSSIAVREPLELLTEIANTLAFDLSATNVVWVCEGADDKDALAHHAQGAGIYVAGNKSAVLACAATLSALGDAAQRSRRWRTAVEVAWFLVDRDHDGVPEAERVLATTACSLEADLLEAAGSSAMKALILGIDDRAADELAEAALAATSQIGLLRRHNHHERLGLRLSGFPMDRVIDSDRAIDWDRVMEVLDERHRDNQQMVRQAVSACSGMASLERQDQPTVANGHDLVRAMQSLVNRHSNVREGVSGYSVFRALVSSADPTVLKWLQLPLASRSA